MTRQSHCIEILHSSAFFFFFFFGTSDAAHTRFERAKNGALMEAIDMQEPEMAAFCISRGAHIHFKAVKQERGERSDEFAFK